MDIDIANKKNSHLYFRFLHKKRRTSNLFIESIPTQWFSLLERIWNTESFCRFSIFMEGEYERYRVSPKKEDIFRSLEGCILDYNHPFLPFPRVVILDDEPCCDFFRDGSMEKPRSDGLSYSCSSHHISTSSATKNIFLELVEEGILKEGDDDHISGDLSSWTSQGVLLMNLSLTSRMGAPGFHGRNGWYDITDEILTLISRHGTRGVVFMLWGNLAQSKEQLILQHSSINDKKEQQHLILKAPHPSPITAKEGFLGCGHFSKANDYFKRRGYDPIDWSRLTRLEE